MIAGIDHFKNSCVRDLAWAIASPPLVQVPGHDCQWLHADDYLQMYRQTRPWLEQLDRDPSALQALMAAQKDRRLGKHFETLWYFWLVHHPHYDVLANNLQVVIDGETLGELDFIVRDKRNGEIIHIELAVKFYLGLGDTRQMASWHGPGLKDRLDRKVEHLCEKQTRITHDQRVRQWLAAQGLVIDRCAVILKGRLYYPAGQLDPAHALDTSSVNSPLNAATGHLSAWWFRRAELDRFFTDMDVFWPLLNEGWLQRKPTSQLTKKLVKSDFFSPEFAENYRFPLHVQVCNPHFDCDIAFITGDSWGLAKI